MRFEKAVFLGAMVILMGLIGGCNTSKETFEEIFIEGTGGPVTIFSPENDETLISGQTFEVNAAVNLAKFHFEVGTIKIRLWNVSTKFEHTWEFRNLLKSGIIQIHESLEIPATVPPGDDYRLSVSGFSADKSVGLGFTIPVKVLDASSEN